jgi:hypothetical protein
VNNNKEEDMEAVIHSKFVASINGLVIENEQIFNTVKFLLERINERFGEVYNQEFIENMVIEVQDIWLNTEGFSFDTLEVENAGNIEQAANFQEIKISYSKAE